MAADASGGIGGDWGALARMVLQVNTSVSSTPKTGNSAEQAGSRSSVAYAESDQNVGKVGPLLGEWSPELFARMSAEY